MAGGVEGACLHCGMWHTGRQCPRVKAVEYYECGTVKRVEYHDSATIPVLKCAHRTADGRRSGRCVACGSEFVSLDPPSGEPKKFASEPRDMDFGPSPTVVEG